MKWFKHMTNSFDDEKLSAVVDALGMEGYGFWWRLLEIVASKMDEKGETFCSFSDKKWGNFFGFSAKKFRNFVEIFKKFEIFEVEFFENCTTVNIPNLSKYKDEWSRKKSKNSGVSPDKLRSKEVDKEKDIYIPPTTPKGVVPPTGGNAHTREGKKTHESSRAVVRKPPTVEDVEAYCAERGNTISAERFCDYYAAQGWRLSNGQPLRDWKAAVRNWEGRNAERPAYPAGRHTPLAGMTDAERRDAHNRAVLQQVAADLDAAGSPF